MYRLSSIIVILCISLQARSQSPHGELFKIDCAVCHNSTGWVVTRDSVKYDHNKSVFNLDGMHSKADCKSCHITSIFSDAPTQCSSCHSDVHSMTVGSDCARCHTTQNWLVNNISEIHEENGFMLTGSHSSLSCIDCHSGETNLSFERIGNDCINCHNKEFIAAKNPDHINGGFSTNCVECHDPISNNWSSDNFNHDFFPLTLGHAINDCNRCHKTGNFSDASGLCNSCHMQDYLATNNPNHPISGISTSCVDCHSTDSWTPSTFDHSIYPFVGAHAAIANDCNLCHHGNYNNTPNDCNGCHMPDYTATTSPNHISAQFPTDCAACHNESAWIPGSFDHSSFPLVGGHAGISDCNECHHGNYNNTPNTCDACHLPDYNATTNPNHSTSQFPTDCAVCHNESAWIPSSFDHSSFPLIGGHAGITNCNDCHHGNFNNTPNTCNSCHMPDYNATTNPNHSSAQFPTDCAVCHNESAWIPSSFNHSSFPLIGGHAGITDCNDCHHGSFTNTPNTCNSCHMPDYNATTNPNHSSAQFPTDCAMCHNENAWTPSGFNHNSFPLLGAHAGISNCNDCHHGNFQNTPNTCSACHMTEYTATTNPNHGAAQFPTDCAVCHNETAWIPSGYNHNTIFPLVGAHAAITNCNDCHHGNFTNTPNTCNGCHMPDYNAATSPNHSAAQFPTDCASCHNESAWTPSTFDHDALYFPIYSGKHRGEWSSCNDCHTTASNYALFSCIDCHEHSNQSSVNNEHNGVSGYSYNSTACLNCHPNGN